MNAFDNFMQSLTLELIDMPDEDVPGAHHLTPDSVEATIRSLEAFQRGEADAVEQFANKDHQTWAGILALQLRFLRGAQQ